jgi:hypothetical protein
MLDLRSSTLKQLALVKPHTQANTDQNCSFEKAINYNCAARFFWTRINADLFRPLLSEARYKFVRSQFCVAGFEPSDPGNWER